MEWLLGVLAQGLFELNLRLHMSVCFADQDDHKAYRVELDLSNSRLARGSHNLHDLHKLVIVVSPPEQGVSCDHFRKTGQSAVPTREGGSSSHAPHTPDVDTGAIGPRAQ